MTTTNATPAVAAIPFSPAAERNKQPISAVLGQYLAPEMEVLEIACGLGQHSVYLAERFPEAMFRPTDLSTDAISVTQKRLASAALPNVMQPRVLDVEQNPWSVVCDQSRIPSILCCNMIHIAPFSACEGLFRGAKQYLRMNGNLFLYGPFFGAEANKEEAPSNVAFDCSLRRRNVTWGIREVAQVEKTARDNGFNVAANIAMPSNNRCLVFAKVNEGPC